GAGALLARSPLLAPPALAILIESGRPLFFRQRRYGFNQQEFRIIKFRTMTTLDDGDVVLQARHNDPRVTPLGRFLRKWNIDELPQLVNVLKGDMSLVGPRPHALSHNREYEQKIALYARRHNVLPGIRSEERRVGQEWRSRWDGSSDWCSSDLTCRWSGRPRTRCRIIASTSRRSRFMRAATTCCRV